MSEPERTHPALVGNGGFEGGFARPASREKSMGALVPGLHYGPLRVITRM
jgi:hypothetical protein